MRYKLHNWKLFYLLFFSFFIHTKATDSVKHYYIDSALKDKKVLQSNLKGNPTEFYVFSHGRPGELLLNGRWLKPKEIVSFLENNINDQTTHLLIYACEFGKGEKGKRAVRFLESELHISVSASDDITGKSGDWELEVGRRVKTDDFKEYQYDLQCLTGVMGGTLPNDDFDNDGICNLLDIDDDNDGILDHIESPNCFYSEDEIAITNATSSLTNYSTNGSYLFSELYDGVLNDIASYGANNTTIDGETIYQLEMAFPIALSGIQNYYNQSIFKTGATYKWQGFDGSTWVDVTPTLTAPTQSANGDTTDNFTLNPDKYSSYRILGISGLTYYNRVYEFVPIANNFNPSFYPKASCTDNWDGDAFPNHLDLDSDADGCSDAFESGATTNTAIDFQFAGSVGSNGLMDILETSLDSGEINYVSTYNYAQSDFIKVCADSDNDLINDLYDIDDDNDGIIDAVESPNCFYSTEEIAIINASTSLTNYSTNGSYLFSELYDGIKDDLASFGVNNTTIDGETIYQLDMSFPVKLTGIQNYYNQSIFKTGATYKWQGFDGINWIDVTPTLNAPTQSANGDYTDSFTQNLSNYISYRLVGISGLTYYNHLYEFVPISSDYQASLYPKNDCSDNVDGDLFFNHLDLDSDDDGCSDALEASATTVITPNYQFSGNIGNNGLLNSLETAADSGIINYSSTEYYSRIASINACDDTDNDSIPNIIDIDDDNDGILDDTERACGLTTAEETSIVTSPAGSQQVEGKIGNAEAAATFSIDLSDASANLVAGNFFYNSGVSYEWNDGSKEFSSTIKISPDTEDILKTVNWGPNVNGSSNTYYDNNEQTITLDWSPSIIAILHDPNNEIDLVDGSILHSGDSFYQSAALNNGTGTWFIEFQLNDLPLDFTLTSHHVSSTNLSHEGYSFNVKMCSLLDTDGDHTPNYLDLDSDDDGCSDALEASATTDLTSDYVFTGNVSNNGLDNSLETVTDSGIINYSSTYELYALVDQKQACKVDVEVLVTSDKGNGAVVLPEDQVEFTIEVTNHGPILVATNSLLTDNLLEDFDFVSASATQGTYTSGIWDIGSLAIGQTQTLTLVGKVISNPPNIVSINETFSATETDANVSLDDEFETFRINNIAKKITIKDVYLDEDGNVLCDGDNDATNNPDFIGLSLNDAILNGGTLAAIVATDTGYSTDKNTSAIENKWEFDVPSDILPASAKITITGIDKTSNLYDSNAVFGEIDINFTDNTYGGYLYDFGDNGSSGATGADFTFNNLPIGSEPGTAGDFNGRNELDSFVLSRVGNHFTLQHSGSTGVDEFSYLIEYMDGYSISKDLSQTESIYMDINSADNFVIDISNDPDEVIITGALTNTGNDAHIENRGEVRVVLLRQADGSYVATGNIMYDKGNTEEGTTNYSFENYSVENGETSAPLFTSMAIGDTDASGFLADFKLYQTGSTLILDRTAELEAVSYGLFTSQTYSYVKDTDGSFIGASVQHLGTTFGQGDLDSVGGSDFCFPILTGSEAGTINFSTQLNPTDDKNENGGVYSIDIDLERDSNTGEIIGGSASGYISLTRVNNEVDLVSFKNIDISAPGIQLVNSDGTPVAGVVTSNLDLDDFTDPQAGGVIITLEDCNGSDGIRIQTVASTNAYNKYIFEAANANWVGRLPVNVSNVPDFISTTSGNIIDGGTYEFSIFELNENLPISVNLPDNYNNSAADLATNSSPLKVYFSDNPNASLDFNVYVISNTQLNTSTCPPTVWANDPSTESIQLADEAEYLAPVDYLNGNASNVFGNRIQEVLSTSSLSPDQNSNGWAVSGFEDKGVGTWQYSLEGTTWVNIPTDVSSTHAFLLSNDDKVRFVPNGSDPSSTTDPTITYYAWNEEKTVNTAGTYVNPLLRRGWIDTNADNILDLDLSTEFSMVSDFATVRLKETCDPANRQLLNWTTESWTAGDTTYSDSSLGVTNTVSYGATFTSGTPALLTTYQGDQATADESLILSGNAGDLITKDMNYSLQFNGATNGVEFKIFDVDGVRSATVNYEERVIVKGYLNGVEVSPVLSGSAIHSISGNEVRGIDAAPDTGAGSINGVVNVAFASQVDKVEVIFDVVSTGPDTPTTDTGMGIYDVNFCQSICYKIATGTGVPSFVGISTLNREEEEHGEWPESVKGGYLVLDSKEKGFVITRLSATEINALTPTEGMLVYDETNDCLKMYNGTDWFCIVQTCDE